MGQASPCTPENSPSIRPALPTTPTDLMSVSGNGAPNSLCIPPGSNVIYVGEFGAPQDGRFREPTDVAFDSQGNIYISDGYINSRVAKYDMNGDWVMSWGEPGTGPGQLRTPHSIAIDRDDNVYVGDRARPLGARLGLAAEHPDDSALGVHADDHVGALVHRPYVVVGIDPEPVRERPSVES